MYVFTVNNTEKVAKEQYYQRCRSYSVWVEAEDLPHHIKVWLVDHTPETLSLTLDDATPKSVIQELEKLILQEKNDRLEFLAEIQAEDVNKLMRPVLSHYWEKEGYLNGKKIPWDDEALVELKARITAIILAKNKEGEKTEARITAEYKEAQVRKKEETAQKVKERTKAVLSSVPQEDLDRYKEGFMPETEQRQVLRDKVIPLSANNEALNLQLYKKLKNSDICSCGNYGEYSYWVDEIEDLTRDQYQVFKALQKAYPNCVITPELRNGSCANCHEVQQTKVFCVETTVGDWTLNRRFVFP